MPRPERHRFRWWWVALPLALAGLAAGGWLGRDALSRAVSRSSEQVGDWATRLQEIAAAEPAAAIEERTATVASRSVLLVLGSGPGDSAFALVAAAPDAPPTLTILPATMLGVVPGYGEFTLGDALSFEGPDLAALTVVNELGVRLDQVLALAPGDLAAALPGQVEVDLPVPLFATQDDGLVPVLPAGPQLLPAADVEMVLVTPGAGDAFEWLQRQAAAWRGILAAIAADPGVADRIAAGLPAGGTAVADLLLAAATSDELLLGTLPVTAVPTVAGEALSLAPEATSEYVPARLGHLLLREGVRPRVEVLNGNGQIGATRVVAEAVVRRGFRVVRTENADRFDYAATLVVAQGEEAQDAAREVAGIVGAGAVYLEEAAPSLVVEVSIIVGLDIPAGEA